MDNINQFEQTLNRIMAEAVLSTLQGMSPDDVEDAIDKGNTNYSIDIEWQDFSRRIEATLYVGNLVFKNEGHREISYERWVDTYWYGWEQVLN